MRSEISPAVTVSRASEDHTHFADQNLQSQLRSLLLAGAGLLSSFAPNLEASEPPSSQAQAQTTQEPNPNHSSASIPVAPAKQLLPRMDIIVKIPTQDADGNYYVSDELVREKEDEIKSFLNLPATATFRFDGVRHDYFERVPVLEASKDGSAVVNGYISVYEHDLPPPVTDEDLNSEEAELDSEKSTEELAAEEAKQDEARGNSISFDSKVAVTGEWVEIAGLRLMTDVGLQSGPVSNWQLNDLVDSAQKWAEKAKLLGLGALELRFELRDVSNLHLVLSGWRNNSTESDPDNLGTIEVRVPIKYNSSELPFTATSPEILSSLEILASCLHDFTPRWGACSLRVSATSEQNSHLLEVSDGRWHEEGRVPLQLSVQPKLGSLDHGESTDRNSYRLGKNWDLSSEEVLLIRDALRGVLTKAQGGTIAALALVGSEQGGKLAYVALGNVPVRDAQGRHEFWRFGPALYSIPISVDGKLGNPEEVFCKSKLDYDFDGDYSGNKLVFSWANDSKTCLTLRSGKEPSASHPATVIVGEVKAEIVGGVALHGNLDAWYYAPNFCGTVFVPFEGRRTSREEHLEHHKTPSLKNRLEQLKEEIDQALEQAREEGYEEGSQEAKKQEEDDK